MSDNLTAAPQSSGGNSGGGAIVDLEFGSAADLRKKLDSMKQKLNLTKEFFREVMVEGVDYGIIPGTNKPTLYKAGAEGLCEFYNLAPTIAAKVEDKVHETGYYAVDVTIRLIHRHTGAIIAEGLGHANTYESRYRWRWVTERDLPREIDVRDLVSKDFAKTGKPPWIKYRLENDDMHSIWNTVLKMSKKRALVDAVLSATRSSGIFSQTQEELDAYLHGEDPEGEQERRSTAPPRQQSNRSAGQSTSPRPSGGTGDNAALPKNRALAIKNRLEMDWNGLAAEASNALGREIKQVMKEVVTAADWRTVADYLEDLEQAGQGNDYEEPPGDLR
ncbi:hypothetical protein SAMN04487969_11925 [Paenibacillus algorifonticola]|uniref:Uncharacterized protein n=1 Tax=Paenibacillus algorifonticola TaxID=684063 RepID=A0A1I2GZF3_9BACL|nr:hypothetical protein [Paenibacillus algorifonticola]SFF22530.1 hypothetical protein SAMN04487969_11925 [Paenibacillus algorifonticola]